MFNPLKQLEHHARDRGDRRAVRRSGRPDERVIAMRKLIMGGIAAAALAVGVAATGTAHAEGAGFCSPHIYVSSSTSCPFAFAVAQRYLNLSGGYVGSAQMFDIYSPVTGEYYDMTCGPAGMEGGQYRTVICRGGNNAEVVLS